jgi:hypothetical protein
MGHIVEGRSNVAVAALLKISPRTAGSSSMTQTSPVSDMRLTPSRLRQGHPECRADIFGSDEQQPTAFPNRDLPGHHRLCINR